MSRTLRHSRQPSRPAPPPAETDIVPAIMIGTVLWLVALVVTLLVLPVLRRHNLTWLPWTCVTGAGLGLFGLWYCLRRDAAIRRSAVPPASGSAATG